MAPTKKAKMEPTEHNKSRHPGFETQACARRDRDLPAGPLYFLHTQIGMHLYVRIDNWERNSYFDKNEKSTRRRETTRVRPRPPPAESGDASKVRHEEQTSHRMMDLISS